MKYIASIVAVLVAMLGVFADPVQAFIAAHPAISAVVAAIGAVIAHLSPQPQK